MKQNNKNGQIKRMKKDNKRGETEVKVLTHKLLPSTLSYLRLVP
jgi:hypothetical protein